MTDNQEPNERCGCACEYGKAYKDCCSGKITIEGNGLTEAEENIREWLTRINDICRIASFFEFDGAPLLGCSEHPSFKRQGADGLPSVQSPMRISLDAMFLDGNLPEVKVRSIESSQLGTMLSCY